MKILFLTLLTNVLWSATCAFIFLPLMKKVSQAKVDEFDVWMWRQFVGQHDVFWLKVEKDIMVEGLFHNIKQRRHKAHLP